MCEALVRLAPNLGGAVFGNVTDDEDEGQEDEDEDERDLEDEGS